MLGEPVDFVQFFSFHDHLANSVCVSLWQYELWSFQTWGTYKIERFLPKNQHTQSKLLNFENWVYGGLRSFQKSEF